MATKKVKKSKKKVEETKEEVVVAEETLDSQAEETQPQAIVEEDDSDIDLIKSLATTVNNTLKRDALMVGDESGDIGVPYWVLSGVPQLDFAVGGKVHPGFPGGRIIEIFGGESSGKSTLAVWLTKVAMEQQKAIAYYQDAERVLTPEIIKGTNIDIRRVIRDQPDTLEEVFDAQETILEALMKQQPDKPVVITLDSVSACSTNAEIDGEMGDQQVGSHARLMSKGMRKIKAYIKDSNVLSIWVNQIREKVGVMWGDNTATSGGKALPFFSSVRLQLTRVKTLKKSTGDPYGCTIQVLVKKNKVAPPLKKVEYDILFIEDKEGSYPRIDVEGAILDWLKEHDIIGGSAGRYEVEGKSYYKDGARAVLQKDKDLFEKYKDLAYSVFDKEGEK